MGCKTRRASLRRAKQAIDDWGRRHRHPPVEAQHAARGRRLHSHCNSLQLLRRPWQLSASPATHQSDEAGVVSVAVPSQPAQASHVGEVDGSPPTEASAPPTDHGPDLGGVTTSHIDGRAGWWQSPCPDLARGRGGQPPGLLYNGLFHRFHRRRTPTLAPTPRHRKPPPSRSPVRESARQAARRSPPAQGRKLRPRSEDWCKRLRLAVAMWLQTSGTVVMGRLQPSGTRGGASTLRSENAEG